MRKQICALLACCMLLGTLFTLCSCAFGSNTGGIQPGKNNVTRSKIVSYSYFNTVSTIYSYADVSEEEFERYVSTVNDTLSYYHKLFDIYYAYVGINNIQTINKNAGKNPVVVDRELIDFLLYCKELCTITEGKTNIMLGSVLKLWHDAREKAAENDGVLDPEELPSETELAAAAAHTDIDLLVIDEAASTVYITDKHASIDVGAVAKGYVVELLYGQLKEMGADAVALNVGGNLRTVGLKPDGERWITGITNPDKNSSESLRCRVEIGSTSVVTSGDYERFFVSDGVNYHHIIDPVTLAPATYFSSVSIITEHSGLADALSTALFCMTEQEGRALIADLSGVDVIWIYSDGRMTMTDGIAAHLIK